MKKMLAIDTSTEQASIALCAYGKFLTKTNANVKQHADCLLDMIAKLLAETELNFNALDAIVFGCGPGSFTGIRVTCSVAKALAFAHDLPLYPVTSLQAIAYGAWLNKQKFVEDSRGILALLDARMQEFYWQYFLDFKIGKPVVSSLNNINIPTGGNLIIAGPNLQHLQFEFLNIPNLEIQEIFPLAENMIKLVQAGYIKAVNASTALPLYVRNQIVSGV